ncbi:zinc finger cchc-type protein [Diplodia corticola]|uniref:Zinc finger cchc-type protein n=1 Tax=Diplodia corticola TaxID=236234 RepID=A0A1J9QVA6_9PEZI|nr:zinc finger cchc-type protein [Diplodia corticola]OJD32321.1 zinc finger cchc-type protein [Diplodia corticola]
MALKTGFLHGISQPRPYPNRFRATTASELSPHSILDDVTGLLNVMLAQDDRLTEWNEELGGDIKRLRGALEIPEETQAKMEERMREMNEGMRKMEKQLVALVETTRRNLSLQSQTNAKYANVLRGVPPIPASSSPASSVAVPVRANYTAVSTTLIMLSAIELDLKDISIGMRCRRLIQRPTAEASAAALDTRQLEGTGVVVYHDGRGCMRAYGLLRLTVQMFDVFRNYGDGLSVLSMNTYTHCRRYMLNQIGNAGFVADMATWDGLVRENSTPGKSTVGIQVDFSAFVGDDGMAGEWDEFVTAVLDYFRAGGGTSVRDVLVDDAFAVGRKVRRQETGLKPRQDNQVCATPLDIRGYFVEEQPEVPDTEVRC